MHALKLPYLRSLLQKGAYSRGVTGVWPTVTYPSHTTLLTGVWPAEHGIYNNLEFDPKHNFAESWFWYAQQIRVPTLWQAAHDAGLSTASVGWPASVGAAAVDFLIPEYWRIFRPTEDLNPSDAHLMEAVSRPEGMLQKMQMRLGPYMFGNDPSPPGDEVKTRFALDILREHKPKFMTIHLSSLDEVEHLHGPFSAEANQQMEVIDGQLAQLFAAALANDPNAVTVVVSDHGFVQITHRVNLMSAFLRADLAKSGGPWKAVPWGGGGTRSPSPPADERTKSSVRELLQGSNRSAQRHRSDSRGRCDQRRGAFPNAFVVMEPAAVIAIRQR